MKFGQRCICWIALALTSAAPAFCAEIPWFNNKPRQPDRITVFWTDTVLNQPGVPSVRGFGGRLMFFASGSDKPVKVEGSLHVFGYDDTDNDLSQMAPDRKYIFTADQLERHYSKAKLGHSYSFWIPWDQAGGEQRVVSLVCRFESKEGGSVISESLRQVLPGKAPLVQPGEVTQEQLQTAVQHAGQAATPGTPAETQPVGYQEARARSGLQTSTINLPPNYQWRNVPEQATPAPLGQVMHATALGTAPALATHGAGATELDPALVATAARLLSKALADQQGAHQSPPAADSRFQQFRALGGPIQQPRGDHVRMRPRPPGWPSHQPASPQPYLTADPPSPLPVDFQAPGLLPGPGTGRP
jgi:hypothetical protein